MRLMKGRILAVDDELHMLKLLERVFAERTQHRITTTNNPLEVAGILEQERFDIIITDLRMPGMDGMEILRWMADNDRDEQVIIITAFGSVESAREAVSLGAFDYINKPFKQEELLFAVDRALHFAAMRKDFKQAHKLFSIQPLSEATEQFTSAYIRRLALTVDNDPQVVAERSGLNLDEVKRLLQKENDRKL
jgi:DNA-binding NtrC family response regulator